jgi:hypothetical protein
MNEKNLAEQGIVMVKYKGYWVLSSAKFGLSGSQYETITKPSLIKKGLLSEDEVEKMDDLKQLLEYESYWKGGDRP